MRIISHSAPLWARIGGMLVFAGVSAAIAAVNVSDYTSGRATAWVFLPVILLVLALMTFAYRAVMVSFRADAAGLVIRNFFRTRQIPVTEIVGFDIGARFQLAPNGVRVLTRSGTFPIDAYGRQPDLFLDVLCDITDELDDWLAEAREHSAKTTPPTLE